MYKYYFSFKTRLFYEVKDWESTGFSEDAAPMVPGIGDAVICLSFVLPLANVELAKHGLIAVENDANTNHYVVELHPEAVCCLSCGNLYVPSAEEKKRVLESGSNSLEDWECEICSELESAESDADRVPGPDEDVQPFHTQKIGDVVKQLRRTFEIEPSDDVVGE